MYITLALSFQPTESSLQAKHLILLPRSFRSYISHLTSNIVVSPTATYRSRWFQSLPIQEAVDDIVSTSRVVMEIDAMSCLRLDVGRKVARGDLWEVH